MKEPTKTSLNKYFEPYPELPYFAVIGHIFWSKSSLCPSFPYCAGRSPIEAFSQIKKKFLRRFLSLPDSIHSQDTINRVFSDLCDPNCSSLCMSGGFRK